MQLHRQARAVAHRSTRVSHRLLSIAADAVFVESVRQFLVRGGGVASSFPWFGNRRNGAWYAPRWSGGECCFKSTDGHTGTWAFSLTRLNLHLIAAAASHGGVVIVDSTRRGKVCVCAFLWMFV